MNREAAVNFVKGLSVLVLAPLLVIGIVLALGLLAALLDVLTR